MTQSTFHCFSMAFSWNLLFPGFTCFKTFRIRGFLRSSSLNLSCKIFTITHPRIFELGIMIYDKPNRRVKRADKGIFTVLLISLINGS